MEFRPEGLAFFWPLIALFARCISSDMLLANTMTVNPKSQPANVKLFLYGSLSNQCLLIGFAVIVEQWYLHSSW